MNLNFTVEEFLEGIEQAKRLIPKKPTIVVKNATVTGVKLNSKIIDSIPQSKEPIPFYEGLKVYKDDSLDKPHFIVEGEIEKKNYLKWEDLDFKEKRQTIKVRMGNTIYNLFFYKYEYTGYTRCHLCNEEETLIYDIQEQLFNDLHLEAVE